MAGQREVGLEAELALDALDLRDHLVGDLRRVAAHLQQGQHQRGELVAHRQAGEARADLLAVAAEAERRHAGVGAGGVQGNLVAQGIDVLEQGEHFLGLGAVIQGRDDLVGLGDFLEVGLQLGFQVGVEHAGNIPLQIGVDLFQIRGDACRQGCPWSVFKSLPGAWLAAWHTSYDRLGINPI
ncbi:hypothetical protein D3C78_1442860 [compost metagenome]